MVDILDQDAEAAFAMGEIHSCFDPHPPQREILQNLFKSEKDRLFIQCGRKFGKTALAIYALWRWALSRPNQCCYYFSPYMNQTKEILWANRRLQDFGSRNSIQSINNTEMRITFNNGSFIKASGSDNAESVRGITPDFVIYDEYRDFIESFHQVMSPNFASRMAKLLIITTPAELENACWKLSEFAESNNAWKYFSFPSESNPHIDKGWLDREKALLYSRAEGDVWEREYMARRIRGGSNSVFPMFSKDLLVPRETLLNEIKKDLKKLQWFATFDPGTTTVFAGLFSALNPYTKVWYWLDEIYEVGTKSTSVNQIWPVAERKRLELLPIFEGWDDKWTLTADEAAAWFRGEVMDRFGIFIQPTHKNLGKKVEGLSLLNDIFLQKKVRISDSCVNVINEIENYRKDDHGKLQKKNDHLIDCARYQNAAAYYSLNDVLEPVDERRRLDGESNKRAFTVEDDFPNLFSDNDFWQEAPKQEATKERDEAW